MLERMWIILLATFLSVSADLPFEDYVTEKFDADPSFPLLHFAFNDRDGTVYISAVNRIYQLNKSLTLSSLIQTETGPVNDSKNCLPYDCSTSADAHLVKPRDNYNKLLLMDRERNRMLICGSIYQGICEARSLQNISQIVSTRKCKSTDCDFSSEYVSCMSEECTTVAIIAEGPTVLNPVLYVATTAEKNTYNDLASVSTRSMYVDPSLENLLFRLAVDGQRSRKSFPSRVNENVAKKFFKYAFSTDGEDGFVYFVFQNVSTYSKEDKDTSVIARVCKNDPYYSSYIEMNLTCAGIPEGVNPEVQGAFYSKAVGGNFVVDNVLDGVLYVIFKIGTGSALCIYSIHDLNMEFDNTLLACYKYRGRGQDGEIIASTLMGSKEINACTEQIWIKNQSTTLDDEVVRPDPTPVLSYYPNYQTPRGKIRCGAQYLVTQIRRVSKNAVSASWSYLIPDTNLSAITVHIVDDYNVAYLGTHDGKIIELNVNRREIFTTLKLGKPILSDLVLDEDKSLAVPHLYVMTSSQVFHVRVSACEQHTTCTSCLQAHDPYCGWCILSSRCLPRTAQCPLSSLLKPLTNRCILASTPEPLERSLAGNVQTEVDLLPKLPSGHTYECVFNKNYISEAFVADDERTVTCKAPPAGLLPPSFEGRDYVNVSLSIRYNRTADIVWTSVTFYDCRAHGSTLDPLQPCNSCLSSQWSDRCQWCVEKHLCVPQGEGVCTTTTAPQDCPRVTTAADENKLLSVGLPSKIAMNVLNLPTEGAQYSCLIEIQGNEKPITLPAKRSDSGAQIICEEEVYKYLKEETEVPANVTIFWKPGYVVDTGTFNPISFYNCSVKFDDCSLCVTSKPTYKCGWCDTSLQCTAEQLCVDSWITDSEQCPAPEILSFTPTSGPVRGNTTVTIRGVNMGVEVADVQSVVVADVHCVIQPALYKVSKEIVCVTSEALNELNGKVSVTVREVTKTSDDEFYFRNPKLEKLTVKSGPVKGGTTTTILGKNLQTGSSREVFIGNISCKISTPQAELDQIQCQTQPAPHVMLNQTLTVSFDGFKVFLPNAFSYLNNPEIVAYSTASEKLASFLAGGREMVFLGTRLCIVQEAHLIAFIDVTNLSENTMSQLEASRRGRSLMRKMSHHKWTRRIFKKAVPSSLRQFSSQCALVNDTNMICPTPKVSLTIGDNLTRNVSDKTFIRASMKLILDNLDLPLKGELKYYPNPVVHNLTDDHEPTKEGGPRAGMLLKIKVLNLNEDAIRGGEIRILIGTKMCPVESMDKGFILCSLPERPEGKEDTFDVTVQIGNKIWPIGSITYYVDPAPPDLKWIIIGCAMLIVVLAIIGTCFWFKKNKHYKENKNDFQKAIENLEMSVRADFRKAFAELSTDMTDLTADIGDVGLPILSYRQYATNMFFPSVRYHPCMKEPDPTEKPIPAVEQGLTQFALLITNKHFLLSFIRTLEQQRGFSNRDKGNVASLITVVLHKKLDYFTEVMKSLISELITACVQRNPKLVLRRTESVAERMFSNWMAICLFPYINDKAGKPLFVLQKAIKHQVSKGALDMMTGKARYTLNDDRLLKEDTPNESMTLFVSQSESHDDEPVIVKVLSCDSISQVKEKVMDAVYKRIPFSHRPKAEQLDLEWRHGRSGRLVLPDIDYANEPGSRWRRVMTIKDYKVENNATMALIPRQQNMYGSQDIVSQLANHSPDTSVVSPMLPEESTKVYHLVKYTDDLEQKRESTIPRDRHKHILDLYLLRLLNMKGILQSYVDEVFQAILDTNSIPPAVKHFFDFLDELAKAQGIEDAEILHIWKTNSVLGRFWVTIMNNPESVFDIDKPETVESSMAVISQTFIDACSVQEHKPTKDSPINKQLYAKEIPTYKKMVQKYYQDVHDMQPVSDQDMCASMAEISRSHDIEFDVHVAYNELWGYVNKYYEEIQETLENDNNTTQMVIQRLHQAYTLIDNSINNP